LGAWVIGIEKLLLLEGLARHLAVLKGRRFLDAVGRYEIVEYRLARHLYAFPVLRGDGSGRYDKRAGDDAQDPKAVLQKT
jgi:hypothetical protein